MAWVPACYTWGHLAPVYSNINLNYIDVVFESHASALAKLSEMHPSWYLSRDHDVFPFDNRKDDFNQEY